MRKRREWCTLFSYLLFHVFIFLLLNIPTGLSDYMYESSSPSVTVPSPIPSSLNVSSPQTKIPESPPNDVDSSQHLSSLCPSGVECAKLGGECLSCDFNNTCFYGEEINVTCRQKANYSCTGPVMNDNSFNRTMICRYCYQVDSWEQNCEINSNIINSNCVVVHNPRRRFKTNCTVKSNVICLGNRTFPKYVLCNWTAGYKWTTALVLSVTLGGFGADRFYLGHWQEGIGKLFSFGGLGVWTLLDVVLIAVGYLGPADGSLYIW